MHRLRSKSNSSKRSNEDSSKRKVKIPAIPVRADLVNKEQTINSTGYLGDVSDLANATQQIKPATKNGQNCKGVWLTDWSHCNSMDHAKEEMKAYETCCIDESTLPLVVNSTVVAPTIKARPLKNRRRAEELKHYLVGDESKATLRPIQEIKDTRLRSATSSVLTPRFQINTPSTNLEEPSTIKSNNSESTMAFYETFRHQKKAINCGSKVMEELSEKSGKYRPTLNSPALPKPPNQLDDTEVAAMARRMMRKGRKLSPIIKFQDDKIGNTISEKDASSSISQNPAQPGSKAHRKSIRKTFAQELEETFCGKALVTRVANFEKEAIDCNQTFRDNLEDTLARFDIHCIANSTERICDSNHHQNTFPDQMTHVRYLSASYVKGIGYTSVNTCTTIDQSSRLGGQSIHHFEGPEMVRVESVSDQNTAPTSVAVSELKCNGTSSSRHSIMDDHKRRSNLSLFPTETTRNELVTAISVGEEGSQTSIQKDALTFNSTSSTNGSESSYSGTSTTELVQEGQPNLAPDGKGSLVKAPLHYTVPKPFIEGVLIEDFKGEMLQSVNDLCDFLTDKVKNEHAIELVQKKFIENAKFLYEFYFVSSRQQSNQ